MLRFDRRRWLHAAGIAIGGLSISRVADAQQASHSEAVPAASAGSRPIARLSLNENPFGPAPSVVAALQLEFGNLCRYTDSGYQALIGLIAVKEGVPPDQIILGEILEPLGTYLSLQGGPSGEFIHSDPSYTALIHSAVAVGGRAIGVPLDSKLQNDLPAIAAKVNARTRAVYLVNPHNPTGIVSDSGELKHFARQVSRNALVIVDEAYLEFADHFAERTLTDLVRAGANVIVFRTFAKAYGLAGLDIGYGLVPKAIAQSLHAQGLNNPHLFNRLAVAAATASLLEHNYLASVTQRVAEEREKWFGLFRDLNVKFTPSSGNFVFFETGMQHDEFAAALSKRGVEIGRPFPPFDRWARISIGLPDENSLARRAVRAVLSKLPG
jgi:histidinol-phosphate aminotransferase